MQNFSYLIGCPKTRIGAVVDCGFDAEKIIETAKTAGIKIEHILLTHVHFDHSGAADKLAGMTGATLWMNAQSKRKQTLSPAHGKWIIPRQSSDLKDGDRINVGNLKVRVIAAPGHQADHLMFVIGEYLFTGDTLFIDGVGRTDLPDSDALQMQQTLTKIRQMDDDLIICPGHDYGKVPMRKLGEEKRSNPYLARIPSGEE